ncbi:MAG: hypothetical protein U9Q96_01805 [Patescibacteria group bacterium]|nr:hypothetical protein [Patescibacteria group bacterium]
MRMVFAIMVMTSLLVIPVLAFETEQTVRMFPIVGATFERISGNSFQEDSAFVQILTDVALGLSFEELAYLASQISTPKVIASKQMAGQEDTSFCIHSSQFRQILLIFDIQRGLATIYRESPFFIL